jgi:hypothetical protein
MNYKDLISNNIYTATELDIVFAERNQIVNAVEFTYNNSIEFDETEKAGIKFHEKKFHDSLTPFSRDKENECYYELEEIEN